MIQEIHKQYEDLLIQQFSVAKDTKSLLHRNIKKQLLKGKANSV